ncbi:MAG TPA: hypothetical protein VN881_09815 [Candidatus Acidoferrales bacterium]|nr:hypothetical protein [Candidatus Acidoferrales bacterium]
MSEKSGGRRVGAERELNSRRLTQSRDNVTPDPQLPEIIPPPTGLMRKRRPAYVWIGLALLLGGIIALFLIFASD